MRIGVVGCGYWGSKHVRVLQGIPEVSGLVAVDGRPDRRDEVSRTTPGVRTFAALHEALPHVDALVVATPPTSHAALALRALRAGKHVLVEKPLATSVADAATMVAEADAGGLVLMAGHTFEYNAAVWKLRDLVQAGTIGDIYYVDTARLNLGLYQADINVVWDLAPHDISIVNHVLGATPTTVQAWGSSHAHVSLQDVAYVRLEYADLGVTAQVHVSWLDPCKVRRVTVVGSQKMAVYNDLNSEERLRIYDRGVAQQDLTSGPLDGVPMSYRYGEVVSPYIRFDEPLRVEDEHFIECIATGRRPATDGRSGLAVVRVLEGAQESLQRGVAIPLEPSELVVMP